MTVGDSLSTLSGTTAVEGVSRQRTTAQSPATSSSTAANAEQKKLVKAATDFEALLISQMLKTAHEEGGGWLGTGEDDTSSSTLQMADEQFGQALAQQGGLGLAKFVVSEFKGS